MALTDLVETLPDSPSRELIDVDIFYSGFLQLFTDDIRDSHGHPGERVTYKSSRFGDIQLQFAKDNPDDTSLFAHYLWNAAILMCELISSAPTSSPWSVKNETVIELGAGSGVAGIISTLAEATQVWITDYPSNTIIENIQKNCDTNIPNRLKSHYFVDGHEWGDFTTDFAVGHKGVFSRVLAADCFWMPNQHANLTKSILHFLKDDPRSRVLAIGGFHTGRACIVAFFDEAISQGLMLETIVEKDTEGEERPWLDDRGVEDPTERKRWLVVAVLRRQQPL